MVLDVPVVEEVIMSLLFKLVIVAPLIEPIAVIQASTVSQFAVKVLVTAEPPSTVTINC